MLVFLGSVVMVVLAEMGDKTQLLAMAMATRFPARSVLLGVFAATVLNHALAVAAGGYLGTSLNLELIQMIASGSFILFGLWTIRGDSLDGEENRKTAWGPVITVAIAFFLAEMGDKTQLATVALAAKYSSPLATLAGTTTGMMIADALGIYIGVVAGGRIPEKAVKWLSALIFITFGYIGLYYSVPGEFVTIPYITGLIAATALAAYLAGRAGKKEEGTEETG
ncbi:MAG: TMEM165/GDT1 family protein [Firmicutes bacterium]|nr:TMEM165/GDT1 family protein [Bacillota bacterium]MCL5057253.1 TMEM165/GDT1 family protein [Actinomycetota bacterium]